MSTSYIFYANLTVIAKLTHVLWSRSITKREESYKNITYYHLLLCYYLILPLIVIFFIFSVKRYCSKKTALKVDSVSERLIEFCVVLSPHVKS